MLCTYNLSFMHTTPLMLQYLSLPKTFYTMFTCSHLPIKSKPLFTLCFLDILKLQ